MIFQKDKELNRKPFVNEKELQTFFENHLEAILNLKFVETEFAVGNFRIDTLGFNAETKSFYIIEYKNIRNHSLIDQGYTYLKLLLEHKADFVLRYNEKTHTQLRLADVSWEQSRIIFVSPQYTPYQLNATDLKISRSRLNCSKLLVMSRIL